MYWKNADYVKRMDEVFSPCEHNTCAIPDAMIMVNDNDVPVVEIKFGYKNKEDRDMGEVLEIIKHMNKAGKFPNKRWLGSKINYKDRKMDDIISKLKKDGLIIELLAVRNANQHGSYYRMAGHKWKRVVQRQHAFMRRSLRAQDKKESYNSPKKGSLNNGIPFSNLSSPYKNPGVAGYNKKSKVENNGGCKDFTIAPASITPVKINVNGGMQSISEVKNIEEVKKEIINDYVVNNTATRKVNEELEMYGPGDGSGSAMVETTLSNNPFGIVKALRYNRPKGIRKHYQDGSAGDGRFQTCYSAAGCLARLEDMENNFDEYRMVQRLLTVTFQGKLTPQIARSICRRIDNGLITPTAVEKLLKIVDGKEGLLCFDLTELVYDFKNILISNTERINISVDLGFIKNKVDTMTKGSTKDKIAKDYAQAKKAIPGNPSKTFNELSYLIQSPLKVCPAYMLLCVASMVGYSDDVCEQAYNMFKDKIHDEIFKDISVYEFIKENKDMVPFMNWFELESCRRAYVENYRYILKLNKIRHNALDNLFFTLHPDHELIDTYPDDFEKYEEARAAIYTDMDEDEVIINNNNVEQYTENNYNHKVPEIVTNTVSEISNYSDDELNLPMLSEEELTQFDNI